MVHLWLESDLHNIPTIDGMTRDVCGDFGKRLRLLRKARGWRQLDLAVHAGISENYVSELELGQKEICLRTIACLAQALGMSIEELMSSM